MTTGQKDVHYVDDVPILAATFMLCLMSVALVLMAFQLFFPALWCAVAALVVEIIGFTIDHVRHRRGCKPFYWRSLLTFLNAQRTRR
jgi:hypothetical protein